MKKILVLVVALILVGCSSAPKYTAGVYEGEADGRNGKIKVSVTLTEDAIEKIEILEHQETEEYFAQVKDALPDEIIEKQSTDVDAKSGSTLSSEGLKNAVDAAISQAK